MDRITIFDDGAQLAFHPGDTIDLGELGLIRWFPEPVAGAMRIIDKARIEEVQRIIAFVKAKRTNEIQNKPPGTN